MSKRTPKPKITLGEYVKRTETHTFGDPLMNVRRALWAEEAVQVYMRRTGLQDADGIDTAIKDLLCGLMHLCDGLGFQFQNLSQLAEDHYSCETYLEDDISPGKPLTRKGFARIRSQIDWRGGALEPWLRRRK